MVFFDIGTWRLELMKNATRCKDLGIRAVLRIPSGSWLVENETFSGFPALDHDLIKPIGPKVSSEEPLFQLR